MKVHITIKPNNKNIDPLIPSSKLVAIMYIFIECPKDRLFEAAEAINNSPDLCESVYAVSWSYYLEQGIILAYCSAVFLTDKKRCEQECDKIRSTLTACM